MNYQKYLQSDRWEYVRRCALNRSKYDCKKCGHRDALDVHHLSYERLGNERDEDLIVLCRRCHKDLHYFGQHKMELQEPVTEEEYVAVRDEYV